MRLIVPDRDPPHPASRVFGIVFKNRQPGICESECLHDHEASRAGKLLSKDGSRGQDFCKEAVPDNKDVLFGPRRKISKCLFRPCVQVLKILGVAMTPGWLAEVAPKAGFVSDVIRFAF